MSEFSIQYDTPWADEFGPHGGTSKIRFSMIGGCYEINLDSKYNPQNEGIEEFFPKELAVQLISRYPNIPPEILTDFAYDAFAALQRFDLQHIDDAFDKILTEQEKES